MRKLPVNIILIVIIASLLMIAAFFWNESRKEIVFLCGNFKKGVSEQSVRSQLDTGKLLRYHTEMSPLGKRIIVDSPYNFYMYKCIVDIDTNGLVIEHHVE